MTHVRTVRFVIQESSVKEPHCLLRHPGQVGSSNLSRHARPVQKRGLDVSCGDRIVRPRNCAVGRPSTMIVRSSSRSF